ncbi:MAG: flagellar basal body L-ring protein FlgH [Spirochaetia bacterium]
MKIQTGILFFLTVITGLSGAENLWTSDFQGYIAEKPVLTEGRLLRVIIDSSTQLDLSASYNADKELVLRFSGGDTGNLFAFLPDIDATNRRTAEGEEESSLRASLGARVIEIDDTGAARIQGSRTMTLQDSVQAVTVTGWVAPQNVDAENTVSFDQLADAEIVFRSFVKTGQQILTEEDIEEAVLAEAPEAAAPAPDEEAETTDEEDAPEQPESRYTLSDERKRELLLNYINQFVQLIFEIE